VTAWRGDMTKTSDYWKPVFYLLEARVLHPWLVNARDVKHLPSRPKTDLLTRTTADISGRVRAGRGSAG
jgi:hypothetical protein